VRLRYKIVAYVLAWLAALLATSPDTRLLVLVYMFPLGLAAFVERQWGNSGGWAVLAGCIAVYLVHAWFYFRSRKLWSTLLLFGGLAILLICNVSGCRAMLNTH
jgi:hypothetical protein